MTTDDFMKEVEEYATLCATFATETGDDATYARLMLQRERISYAIADLLKQVPDESDRSSDEWHAAVLNDRLRRAVLGLRVIDEIDGYGVVRRNDVIDLIKAVKAADHPSGMDDEPEAWLVSFGDGSSRVYDKDYSIHQMKACGATAIPLYPRTTSDAAEAGYVRHLKAAADQSQADAVAAIQNTPLTLDHKSNQEETNELITKTQRLLSLWSRPR